MKSSMTEALLIEEAGDRATQRLGPMLTLVLLAFDAAEAGARALSAVEAGRIIDPVASACFREARELLLRPAASAEQVRAGLFSAVFALDVAASREPVCYGPLHQTIRDLVFEALDQTVELELARSGDAEEPADELTSERAHN